MTEERTVTARLEGIGRIDILITISLLLPFIVIHLISCRAHLL